MKLLNFFNPQQDEGVIMPQMKSIDSHTHTWDLVAKTYARPVKGLSQPVDDIKFLEKALFGVTTCTWQCPDCGETKTQEMLGTDENQLADVIDKVDKAGGQAQYIKENDKTYVIMEWVPPIKMK